MPSHSRVLLVVLLTLTTSIGIFGHHDIKVVNSTYQLATISIGPEVDDIMEIVIFRVHFDRTLHYGQTPLQDLSMRPNLELEDNHTLNTYAGNPILKFMPESMIRQSGLVKMSCPYPHSSNNEYDNFPECSGSYCMYHSFGNSQDNPPRFMMNMPPVEEISSVIYSMMTKEAHAEPHLSHLGGTFITVRVLRTRTGLTGDWTHYVPEDQDPGKCKLYFSKEKDIPSGKQLTYASSHGPMRMTGFEVSTFSKRIPSCNFDRMASYMYDLKASIQPNMVEYSMYVDRFDEAMKSIARMKNSATWINCRDHVDGLVRYESRLVHTPADTVCRHAPGTYSWIEDSCCNPERAITVEACVARHEDNLIMDIPTTINYEEADRCGYTTDQEKSLALSIARNRITAEECVHDPAGTGVSKLPFEPILNSMVEDCDKRYGFNGKPPACTTDEDCVEECIVHLGQCKVPFSDRMKHTLSCWQESMPESMEDSLKKVLEKRVKTTSSLQNMLEVASVERCIGPTSYKYEGEDKINECLNNHPCLDDGLSNITKECIASGEVEQNKMGYSTNITTLQEIVEQAVTHIRSNAMAEVLRCKYSLLYENYHSLACERSEHLTEVACISSQSIWPIVRVVDPKEEETTFNLSRCSLTFKDSHPGLFIEHVLAVDPITMFEIISPSEERDEDTIQISSVREDIEQTPFDAIYTAYLMKNGMTNYKTLSSLEYGGVTLKQKREIMAAIPAYAMTHELDEYLVVKNEKGAIVGQIVGSTVKIQLLQKDQDNARMCLRTFPGIPIFKDSFPVPDFALLSSREDGFKPMRFTVEVNEETGEICADEVLLTEGTLAYAPIYRYEEYQDVDICHYDTCLICNGDGEVCAGCDQVPFSGKELDLCEVCGGDDTSCKDCKEIINGPNKLDACGICAGDGSTCICCPGMTNPPACDVEDKCYKVQCLNGGVCAESTGLCSCTLGFSGKNCEINDCNANGFYSPKGNNCVCDRGWAGSNCTTCGVPEKGDMKYLCSPFSLDKDNGYVLTTLPTHEADAIVNGPGEDEKESKQDKSNRMLIEKIMIRGTNYPPIWPGSVGHDGYLRDCSCKKTPIKQKERDTHSEDELGILIPVEESSKVRIPTLFTKNELYMMSIRHHLSEGAKTAIRQRNKRSGLMHPRDVEPKTYDDISERCLDVIDSRTKEVEAHETFFREALHPRSEETDPDCINVTEEEELGAAFWTVLALLILVTLLLILTFVCILMYVFKVPFVRHFNDRVDEFTLRSGAKMRKKKVGRTKRHDGKGKKSSLKKK